MPDEVYIDKQHSMQGDMHATGAVLPACRMQMYVVAGDRKAARELQKAQVLGLLLNTFTHSRAATDWDLCFYTLDLIDDLHQVLRFSFGSELRGSSIHDILDRLQQQDGRTQIVCNYIRKRLLSERIGMLMGKASQRNSLECSARVFGMQHSQAHVGV